jgi:phage terminase large subunit-like protein
VPDPVEELRERLVALEPERRLLLLARYRREKEARRTTWLCEVDTCSGKPHRSTPFPHARRDQRWPFRKGDRQIGSAVMAGRGWGKTRYGAETIRARLPHLKSGRIGLIGRTAADVRDVMVEGESGLLAVFPKWERPEYQPSKRRIVFANGATATCYTADKADQLRGPQHELIWGDEFSTWPKLLDVSVESERPGPEGVLTNALLGLRLGFEPRIILTGTPRPTRDMKFLINTSWGKERFKVVRGRTHDNLDNLAELYRDVVLGMYAGTRAGRQELDGELLDDVEGALLDNTAFDWLGFREIDAKELVRVVVAVDPAVTSTKRSDHTGISVCAVTGGPFDQTHGAILHSERVKGSPDAAMTRACSLYDAFHATALIGEVNNGGDYIRTVLKHLRPDIALTYKDVRASQGKYARADPIALLYRRRRVHHIGNPALHAALENEWTTWTADDDSSPDVLDSTVWGLTHLMVRSTAAGLGRPRQTTA